MTLQVGFLIKPFYQKTCGPAGGGQQPKLSRTVRDLFAIDHNKARLSMDDSLTLEAYTNDHVQAGVM